MHRPLNDFALGEIHRLSNSRGEVDVPLFAVLPLYELNLRWKRHTGLLMLLSMYITRYLGPNYQEQNDRNLRCPLPD